jgi:Holliday junction DNA helicase RuvA
MLSSLEPKFEAIGSGDVATVQSIKGIGVKTAKGNTGFKRKVLKLYDLDEVSMQSNTNRDEALSALRY